MWIFVCSFLGIILLMIGLRCTANAFVIIKSIYSAFPTSVRPKSLNKYTPSFDKLSVTSHYFHVVYKHLRGLLYSCPITQKHTHTQTHIWDCLQWNCISVEMCKSLNTAQTCPNPAKLQALLRMYTHAIFDEMLKWITFGNCTVFCSN